MAYTNSTLVDCTVKSPNHSGTRTHKIDRITPHCVVGQLSAESIGGCFTSPSRQASCNYGIGKDGRVCLIVDEANRSWCSSSATNDQRAITIEVASDSSEPYAFNDAAYKKLVKLCIDICKRNGLKKVLWFADKDTALNYSPKDGECVFTVHRWFANKSCPGNWMFSRMAQLAAEVNAGLGAAASEPETKPEPTKPTTPSTAIKAGDTVKVQSGATYYGGGKTVPAWVVAKEWIVLEVSGDRAVINKSVDGQNAINSPINTKYLTVVGGSASSGTFTPYLVRINTDVLNVRKGPGTDTAITCTVKRNEVFTIVGEQSGWGKLKSGAGWIKLSYTVRK